MALEQGCFLGVAWREDLMVVTEEWSSDKSLNVSLQEFDRWDFCIDLNASKLVSKALNGKALILDGLDRPVSPLEAAVAETVWYGEPILPNWPVDAPWNPDTFKWNQNINEMPRVYLASWTKTFLKVALVLP